MATSNWEDYVYPGTNILRNKADIRDASALDRFERGVTSIRIQEMRERPIQGDFNLAHIQAIHKHIFRDVYEWAGQIRTVDMMKSSGASRTVFAYVESIPQYGKDVHDLIKDVNYGHGQDKKALVDTLTDVYTVLNGIHPFRDGNGRATREFMNALAYQSGHQFNYERVDQHAWNEAAKETAHGNLQPMRTIFYEIVAVERAVAFDKLQPTQALARHPELDGAYKTMMNAKNAGLDVSQLRTKISRDLHAGKIIGSNVTLQESQNVIGRTAVYRGLIVRDAADIGGTFKGEIVAVSSHHALLKVGDMVAIRYERDNLERSVYQGERLAIQHAAGLSKVYAQGKEPMPERGGQDMQMMEERDFKSR